MGEIVVCITSGEESTLCGLGFLWFLALQDEGKTAMIPLDHGKLWQESWLRTYFERDPG